MVEEALAMFITLVICIWGKQDHCMGQSDKHLSMVPIIKLFGLLLGIVGRQKQMQDSLRMQFLNFVWMNYKILKCRK